MNSDVFCPLPWVLQATRNDGVFRVCAHAQNSPCRGEAKNASGEVYQADSANWSEARNSDSLSAIRKDFLNNKWPSACQRCELENKSGIASRQSQEVKRYSGVFEKKRAREVTSDTGIVHGFGPLELDLRFGNRCNLKCTMCSPKSSDLWYQDQVHVWGANFKNWREETVQLTQGAHRVEATTTFDEWYKTPHFLQEVEKVLPQIVKIHFSGGEPLLISRFYEVLELALKVGQPKQLTIEFITNGTLLPDKLLALFPYFKKVNVGISIDAVGEKNDYIRFPSKWQTVMSVLEKLDQTGDNVDPWIAATTMVYNIMDLPELIEWRDQMDFKKINNNNTRPILMDHPLHNPGYLSAQILPLSVKLHVAEKLKTYLKSKTQFASEYLQKNHNLAQQNLNTIINSQLQMMMAEDKSHLLPKFLKYTERLDEVRKNSFWQTFPELANVLRVSMDHKNDFKNSENQL